METMDLSGVWTLKRVADSSERPMAVPGDIVSALIASTEIPDPYYADNESLVQWVGREDWMLMRDFDVSDSMLGHRDVFLDMDVLDTVAQVRLNGIGIGSGNSMFVRFRVSVGHALRPGLNRLEVLIRSPELAAAKEAAALSYPMPCSVYPVSSPHRNLLRKEQCMAGWDWGPCIMTGGIYDGVRVVGIDGPRLESVRTSMRRQGDDWMLAATVDVSAQDAGSAFFKLGVAGSEAVRGVELSAGKNDVVLELMVKEPELWWPAGYGAPRLYDLVVSITLPGSLPAHELRTRIGFRELVVVAQEDAVGKSMFFRVNGRDVFAKGANWIPADSLPLRRTRARIDAILSQAIAANMNCLRVWGGGRYESDDFYELCDEKGILVWQDFMFSCALYPSSKGFLSLVEAETRYQVSRLASHPCLALWCGNNEALGAITWYDESKQNPARYVADYDRLTEGTVGRVVREMDPSRTWWPSSPSAGPDDYSDNWHMDGRGDMHYWTVWHEGKPFSAYLDVKPRFCSEFGFQSFPSVATVASFAPNGEFNITSPSMEYHQRHSNGNSIILETMARYFRMPSGFAQALYLSQVQQAMAIRTAVDWWRSLRPECMGTLYWQLNDVWPVSSWSSLEYDLSWKLLHYEAARFYAPARLALILRDGMVRVVGMNDGETDLCGELHVRVLDFSGKPIVEEKREATIGASSSTSLWEAENATLAGKSHDSFVVARWSDGKRFLNADCFRTEPKRCALQDPVLKTTMLAGSEGLSFVLDCEYPAFFVAPEASGLKGRFSDSGFTLLPGETARVDFQPGELEAQGETVRKKFASSLFVRHLHWSHQER